MVASKKKKKKIPETRCVSFTLQIVRKSSIQTVFLTTFRRFLEKRFLSLSYFLTRLRMRERQIEIKRISLFLSRNRCSDTVICP